MAFISPKENNNLAESGQRTLPDKQITLCYLFIRIQILDPDTLATESMAKNGKRRDTLSGLQSAQTRRKSISTLADIPRESTGVHHIGQLEDSQNNDTKGKMNLTSRPH